MSRVKLKKWLFLPLSALIFGCADEKEDVKVISLDVGTAVHDVYMSALPCLDLDCGPGAELGFIDKVVFAEDSFIVASRGKMYLFGMDGKLMRQIGGVGRGGDEYISFTDCWFRDGELYLYDLNGKKIISYSLEGNVNEVFSLESRKGDLPFDFVVPFGEAYVGKCVWNGTKGESPALALYDRDFKYVKALGELVIDSGLRLGYPLVTAEDESLLYWNPLGRKLFRVGRDLSVKESFEISFGGRNFPSLDSMDEYDLLDLVRDTEWRADHDGPVTYVWEKGGHLLFLYYHGKELRLADYDERGGGVECHRFVDSPESVLYSCAMRDNVLCLFIETDSGVRMLELGL